MTNSVPSREYALIEEIQKECGSAKRSYIKGIGDDCAVRNVSTSPTLISADTMVENVHFRLDLMSPEEVGYKAISSSVSDIYAMAGTGCSLIVQLVFPKSDKAEEQIRDLYRGIGRAVKQFDTPVVGGDIAAGPCWMIAVTVLGDAGSRILYRDGARPGDSIWVTGTPGLSGKGLDLLLKHGRKMAEEVDPEAVTAHVKPEPRKELPAWMENHSSITSLIDISDGVGKESLTVAKESGAGVIIELPESIASRLTEKNQTRSAEDLFLSGGEDYELLFTASPDFTPYFDSVVFTKIGIVTESRECLFIDSEGKTRDLFGGWDHL